MQNTTACNERTKDHTAPDADSRGNPHSSAPLAATSEDTFSSSDLDYTTSISISMTTFRGDTIPLEVLPNTMVASIKDII